MPIIVPGAQASRPLTRAAYDKELHRVDAAYRPVYDLTLMVASSPESDRTVAHVLPGTIVELNREASRLRRIESPRDARLANRSLGSGLRLLAHELNAALALARRGRTAALRSSLVSLPAVRRISAAHDTLFNLGYWRW